jgi:Ca-activated chloride channel homolog
MRDITFAQPEFFYLLLFIPVIIAWYIIKRKKLKPSLKLSTAGIYNIRHKTLRQRLLHLPFALRVFALTAFIMVMARPQTSSKEQTITSEGIDIVLSIDVSGSMLAEDFKPNRIEAAKKVARDFIKGRPNDRIGLVIFAGESFTMCPITTDHTVLINQVNAVKSGLLVDGTAIGEGLATSVSRLKDSQAKSKVIILLTDGVNNVGVVSPIMAGEIAETFGIRVYTIGVGSMGTAPYPIPTPFGTQYQNMEVQIDEDVLRQIAQLTDGQYFRATNNNKLNEIYAEIDQLEKTKVEVMEYKKYAEEYLPLLMIGGLLFGSELFFRLIILRTLP